MDYDLSGNDTEEDYETDEAELQKYLDHPSSALNSHTCTIL
jgi:hypothetical protein